MILTRQEDINHRTISGTVAVLVFGLLLLFFALYNLITPNPPFPGGGSNKMGTLTLVTNDANTDVINYDQIGEAPSVVVHENSMEKFLTDKSSNVSIKSSVSKKTLAQSLAEKYKTRYYKNVEETNTNTEADQQGHPNGRSTGNTKGITDIDGIDPLSSLDPESTGKEFKFDLKGSKLIQIPTLPKDTKEEGKVVVNIVVDSEGAVIDANANGRGTTTSSAILKAKARQAALATKFNADSKNIERKGSITIIFAFE